MTSNEQGKKERKGNGPKKRTANRSNKQDLPTPESPINTNLNKWSLPSFHHQPHPHSPFKAGRPRGMRRGGRAGKGGKEKKVCVWGGGGEGGGGLTNRV